MALAACDRARTIRYNSRRRPTACDAGDMSRPPILTAGRIAQCTTHRPGRSYLLEQHRFSRARPAPMTSQTSPTSGSFLYRCPGHSLAGSRLARIQNASTIPRIARFVHNKLRVEKGACVRSNPGCSPEQLGRGLAMRTYDGLPSEASSAIRFAELPHKGTRVYDFRQRTVMPSCTFRRRLRNLRTIV